MTTISVADDASVQTERVAAIRKVWLRLIPFLFVLYIFNYLDRINIGFAACR
jgi:ACS family 4-hydroxyphenylacetate permease-like MFS transporter